MATKIEIAKWLLSPDHPQLVQEESLDALERQLEEKGLLHIYRDIELPLVDILQKMHERGIRVDGKLLEKYSVQLAKELKSLEQKIYGHAGVPFNLNSPKQLAALLFEKLKINEGGVGRTPGGARSTDAETLSAIRERHPILPLILNYRELFKIKSTYMDPLRTMANANAQNRIHTTFVQTGTATGRLSSQNPNLQNIPATGEWATKIRGAFVTQKGYALAAFDYSQIELRVLASVTSDPKMQEAFQKGKDIHAITAANVFNTDIKKVTKDQRRFAKTLNFGVIYGMGPNAFARAAGVSVADARKFIEEYFSDFASIKEWQKAVIAEARRKGYVENANGRKRWLPQLRSPNPRIAAEAERAAINMPIQGLAADIMKIAMLRVDALMQKEGWRDGVRILLTIHDELVFEIKKSLLKKAMPRIVQEMENAYTLAVPVKVDVHSGKNWAELK